MTDKMEYLNELARRKEESRSLKTTAKYSLSGFLSLITFFLGLVPLFTLSRHESRYLIVPGLALTLVSLAVLVTSGFASVARFRAWHSSRSQN